ncbi:MAG: hypothetical protein ACREOQ_07700 [Gemmatimonadales bacterium]
MRTLQLSLGLLLAARVDLEPIPSLWGHVAGGGGDEGAKPFVNAKIAAFLGGIRR